MSLARKLEKAEVSFNGSLQGHGSGGSLGWRAPEVVAASNLAPKQPAPSPARKLSKKADVSDPRYWVVCFVGVHVYMPLCMLCAVIDKARVVVKRFFVCFFCLVFLLLLLLLVCIFSPLQTCP